jgi:hypothetical protein
MYFHKLENTKHVYHEYSDTHVTVYVGDSPVYTFPLTEDGVASGHTVEAVKAVVTALGGTFA